MDAAVFAQPSGDPHADEESRILAPRFDAQGLVTAVVTDADEGTLLMVAYMNDEALRLTLETGIGHFWSRSRAKLWKKGETSGNTLQVAEMRVDCDQDAVWLRVRIGGDGVACHTGRHSCFYRIVSLENGQAALSFDEGPTAQQPSAGRTPSTQRS